MPAVDLIQTTPLSNKLDLGGIGYSLNSFDQISGAICEWMKGNRQTTRMIGYVNPHVFNIARKNKTVREFLATADIVTVDGIGVVLGLLLVKAQRVEQTGMVALFDRIVAAYDIPRLRAILIGGTNDEGDQAAAAINKTSPKIEVIASYHGFHRIKEYLAILRRHQHVPLMLVGMGTPRSEELLLAARNICSGTLCWSIGGGTIQYYAGTKKRGPELVKKIGMHWAYRMIREPRTSRRYLIGIPVFFSHLLRILISDRLRKGSITCAC